MLGGQLILQINLPLKMSYLTPHFPPPPPQKKKKNECKYELKYGWLIEPNDSQITNKSSCECDNFTCQEQLSSCKTSSATVNLSLWPNPIYNYGSFIIAWYQLSTGFPTTELYRVQRLTPRLCPNIIIIKSLIDAYILAHNPFIIVGESWNF